MNGAKFVRDLYELSNDTLGNDRCYVESSYAGFSQSLASLIMLQMPKCHQPCDYVSCADVDDADVDAADNDDDCFWRAASDMSPLLEQESSKNALYFNWQYHEGSIMKMMM